MSRYSKERGKNHQEMQRKMNSESQTRIALNRLKREAWDAATSRGHELNLFVTDGKIANATCKKCGAEVHVELEPAPNSINISGEAVALNCKEQAS